MKTSMQDHDRETARRLPEEFVRSSVVGAKERIDELVSQHWISHARAERDELTRGLLPVLEPLMECGAVVSHRERDLCEGIVARWAARRLTRSAAKREIPLWSIRSGRFIGWRTEDGEFYNAAGRHIGYFVNEIAHTHDGHAIGEVYGDEWIGRRKRVIYPTGRERAEMNGRDAAGVADRNGISLDGWIDPEL